MSPKILKYLPILNDLIHFESIESVTTAMKVLNEILTTNPEDIMFFHMTGGFNIIMNIMQNNDSLTGICLTVLANASKKDVTFRTKLAQSNFFVLISSKLENEKDFSKNVIVLYSALIIILVQSNYEAQNQMRAAGCLSCLTRILACIVDEMKEKLVLRKNAELIVYAITASIKNPQNNRNQEEVGWIIPKILDHLDKSFVYFYDAELQKTFWSFLKSVLDKNTVNQQIFIDYAGLTVLLRSVQEILEEKKTEEKGELLAKMTGILVTLKYQKSILLQASNYCAIIIICSLFQTAHSLVLQHVASFLDNLIQEIPYVLNVVTDEDLLRGIKQYQIFLKSKKAEDVCQNNWDSTRFLSNLELSLEKNRTKSLTRNSKADYYLYDVCILHDEPDPQSQDISSGVFNILQGIGSKLHKVRQSNFHLQKRLYRKKERNLRKKMRKILHYRVKEKTDNVIVFMMRSINKGLFDLWKFFSKWLLSNSEIREKYTVMVKK